MVGHPNAPLTPLGRRRLCERVDSGRPIAHVAAEAGISRRCLAKWYARWRDDGADGLRDRLSTPRHQPQRTAANVEHLVEQLRRATKYGPAPIAATMATEHNVILAPATVHRPCRPHRRVFPRFSETPYVHGHEQYATRGIQSQRGARGRRKDAPTPRALHSGARPRPAR